MNCPECASFNVRVVDSRPHPTGDAVRRRRSCRCGYRWTTHEISADRIVGADVEEILLLVPRGDPRGRKR